MDSRFSSKRARFSSDEADPFSLSSRLMPWGMSSHTTVTSVPSPASATSQVTRILPKMSGCAWIVLEQPPRHLPAKASISLTSSSGLVIIGQCPDSMTLWGPSSLPHFPFRISSRYSASLPRLQNV